MVYRILVCNTRALFHENMDLFATTIFLNNTCLSNWFRLLVIFLINHNIWQDNFLIISFWKFIDFLAVLFIWFFERNKILCWCFWPLYFYTFFVVWINENFLTKTFRKDHDFTKLFKVWISWYSSITRNQIIFSIHSKLFSLINWFMF